jgi:PTH1 family peptidyl-tRNA hydrolase
VFIKLIVGLGNPGNKYTSTRHNAGFWLVERMAEQLVWKFHPAPKFQSDICRMETANCWLLKPMTFMNLSGRAVAAFTNFYKIPVEQILVAHDDLDFPPGTVRLKQGGSDGKHNGLKSLISHLGTNEFMRLRLGIGHPGKGKEVASYVLSAPPIEEHIAIQSAIENALQVMPLIMQGDFAKAQNQLHSK